jgi:hypothetical protein
MIPESLEFFINQVERFKDDLLKREEGDSNGKYFFGIAEKLSVFIILLIVAYGAIYKLWIYGSALEYIQYKNKLLVPVNPIIEVGKTVFEKNPFWTIIVSIAASIFLIGLFFLVVRFSIYIRNVLKKYRVFSALGLYTAITSAYVGTFETEYSNIFEYTKFMFYKLIGK